SSRRRHTSFSRDWSSDVCSSDLETASGPRLAGVLPIEAHDCGAPLTAISRAASKYDSAPGDAGSYVITVWLYDGASDTRTDRGKIGRASCRERAALAAVDAVMDG